MNDDSTQHPRGRRVYLSLESLYFDPNNYRIVDNPDYSKVVKENVLDSGVQRRTTRLILGNNQENVKDLLASLVANGWLELDPILVENYKRSAYLVLEGNRRVAALKNLSRRYREASIDLGKLDPAVFSRLPVVLHELSDEKQKLVLMGLHHISGKKRWPAVNRALAIRDLQDKFHGNTNDVCRALGISKQEYSLSVRTLALIEAYKESDYGDQFQSDKYNLFREIIKTPHIREWLGWDQQDGKAERPANLERLFRWMSSEADLATTDTEEDERTATEVGPVLTTTGHIRELAKIINDQDALLRLDETRSLQEATLSSSLLVKTEVARALATIDNGIHKLTRRSSDMAADDLDRATQLAGMLHWIASPSTLRSQTPSERSPRSPFNEITRSQFSNIRVLDYRRLNGLELTNLRRVNLIAGVNNAGKTSLLEAIYLLARQNDENALLDVFRWRGRFETDPGWLWFVEQIPSRINIEGQFDEVSKNHARLSVRRVSGPGAMQRNPSTFLAKYEISSCYADQQQETDVALSLNLPPSASTTGQYWLCRSSMASPFWIGRSDALANANRSAIELGTKSKIIRFIKKHVDKHVTNIELVDPANRFLVIHEKCDIPSDLSSFGDGMRRIFEVGMLFASVQGGVLLIDEFENVIHRNLLVPFTNLVQDLAHELNVQVFLTTHSKEALDAFVLNARSLDDLAGFAVKQGNEGIGIRRFDGQQLLTLHNALDFDLRGVI